MTAKPILPFIIAIAFFLAGCNGGPGVRERGNPEPGADSMLWRTGLADCDLEGTAAEASPFAAALIGIGVDFLIGSLRAAIARAAAPEERTFDAYNADYLLTIDPVESEDPIKRACILVGAARTASEQRLDGPTGTPEDLSRAWVEELSEVNPLFRQQIVSDALQLGFSEPAFLVSLRFSKAEDGTAISTKLNYLYYPIRLLERKKPATLVLTVEGRRPAQKEGSTLGVALKFPNMSPARDRVFTALDIPGAQWMSGWTPMPEEWAGKYGAIPNGAFHARPVNLSARLMASAEGSEFMKRLSAAFSDERAKALSTALVDRITRDSDAISDKAEAAKIAARDAYLATLTAYLEANSALQAACADAAATAEKKAALYAAAYSKYHSAKTAETAAKEAEVDFAAGKPELGGPPAPCDASGG